MYLWFCQMYLYLDLPLLQNIHTSTNHEVVSLLKKIASLSIEGGLYAKIMHHFFFETVSSTQIVSLCLSSKFFERFTMIPSLMYTILTEWSKLVSIYVKLSIGVGGI